MLVSQHSTEPHYLRTPLLRRQGFQAELHMEETDHMLGKNRHEGCFSDLEQKPSAGLPSQLLQLPPATDRYLSPD